MLWHLYRYLIHGQEDEGGGATLKMNPGANIVCQPGERGADSDRLKSKMSTRTIGSVATILTQGSM